jgi:hypothetical protein
MTSLKRAIELLRTTVLGLPPSPPQPAAAPSPAGTGQTYTQTLLARFSLPGARWAGKDGVGGTGAADFYNLLASAVGAATGGTTRGPESGGLAASGNLVPDTIQGASARMSFIAAQRERLAILLSALDREASQLQTEAEADKERQPSVDVTQPLAKSRSEADFEKLEAESGEEEGMEGTEVRKRTPGVGAAGGWVSWAWGGGGGGEGKSTGVEK